MRDIPQHATSIRSTVKDFILEEFLQGAHPDELGDDTPLISSRLLDSLASIRLVAFLEERYDIRIVPHEVSVDHLDTLVRIASLVQSKQGTEA